MAVNAIVMNAMDPAKSGWFLIYNGKKYVYPDPQTWGPYSAINMYVGLPKDIVLSQEDFNAIPDGGVVGRDITTSPEELRQISEKGIQTIAKQGQSSYETAAGVIANSSPALTNEKLIANTNSAQTAIDSGGATPDQAYKSVATAGETGMSTWDEDYKKSFEKLSPYYQKVLDMAKGDLDLAKRMIQSDYDLGVRETKEEATANARTRALLTTNIQEKYGLGKTEAEELAKEAEKTIALNEGRIITTFETDTKAALDAYEASKREQALTFPQEKEQLGTTLNRRGVAGSPTPGLPTGGLAGTEVARLKESQDIRKEAIDRALKEKQLGATQTKEFGLQGQELARQETASKLARGTAGLTQEKTYQLGNIGLQAETDQEKVARALATLEAKKGFDTEQKQRGFEKTSMETAKQHETEATTLTTTEQQRKQALEQLNLQKSQIAEQTRLADLNKKLMEKQLQLMG